MLRKTLIIVFVFLLCPIVTVSAENGEAVKTVEAERADKEDIMKVIEKYNVKIEKAEYYLANILDDRKYVDVWKSIEEGVSIEDYDKFVNLIVMDKLTIKNVISVIVYFLSAIAGIKLLFQGYLESEFFDGAVGFLLLVALLPYILFDVLTWPFS